MPKKITLNTTTHETRPTPSSTLFPQGQQALFFVGLVFTALCAILASNWNRMFYACGFNPNLHAQQSRLGIWGTNESFVPRFFDFGGNSNIAVFYFLSILTYEKLRIF